MSDSGLGFVTDLLLCSVSGLLQNGRFGLNLVIGFAFSAHYGVVSILYYSSKVFKQKVDK